MALGTIWIVGFSVGADPMINSKAIAIQDEEQIKYSSSDEGDENYKNPSYCPSEHEIASFLITPSQNLTVVCSTI